VATTGPIGSTKCANTSPNCFENELPAFELEVVLKEEIEARRVRSLPAWQQSAHARITEPLFFVFVALLAQRQGLVIDETARAGKAPQFAKLFAIRQGFEFVALHPQHGIIVVGLWQDIKTFATADHGRH